MSRTPKKKDALVTNTALSFSDAMLISCAAPEKNPLQLILASTGGGRAPMSKIQSAMYRWTYAVENGAVPSDHATGMAMYITNITLDTASVAVLMTVLLYSRASTKHNTASPAMYLIPKIPISPVAPLRPASSSDTPATKSATATANIAML